MKDILTEILAQNEVSREDAEKMALYGEYLIKENEKYNLTRIISVDELAEKHFLDSLSIFDLPGIDFDTEVLDIGTGPGFPGIPYAIVRKKANVTLLDSSGKKIDFIDRGIKLIDINNAVTVLGRAEDIVKDRREQYGLAISRAVAPFNILLELAAGFVKCGGTFVAYKGASAEKEVAEAGSSYKILGFGAPEIVNADLRDFDHKFVVMKKEKETPLKYPRSYGAIKKNPLK